MDNNNKEKFHENYIEGRNAVLEAFRSGKTIDKLFVLDGCQDGPIKSITREARKHDAIINYVAKERLDQMSETGKHQGVIAVSAAYEYAEVSDILENAERKGEPPFIIILDGIEDPHNLGAIIRTANQAGAHGIIIPKRRAVGLTPTVAKTSAGAINYTPVAKVTNISNTIKELKEKGMWFVCADMGGTTMYDLNLTGPIGLVIGNEGDGAGPFVTTGVCLDGIESDKTKENIRKDGDSSDMCAGGFFLNEDGSIYGECMSNYMDLEFYNKDLTGSNRTLIALSNFLKNEIDPALFARAYHQIIMAGYAENSIPLDYLRTGMILAGLSKPEHIKIWLDDVREAPEGYCRCHSVNEAIKKIIECEKEYAVIDEINCDHDLGDYASDGGDGIKLIDWLAERKTHYPVKLHTMNPVGRENMQREIDRYWNETK